MKNPIPRVGDKMRVGSWINGVMEYDYYTFTEVNERKGGVSLRKDSTGEILYNNCDYRFNGVYDFWNRYGNPNKYNKWEITYKCP